ncbi:MAG TPA: NUDIX hydrolase [Gammaproteobacteria bacterium]|nr:NUDIX hydrolase [Gammaproteobacteria bacterium]
MSDHKPIYQGRIIDLWLERVTLPNESQLDLEIVRHPGGAAIVALDEQSRLCLLRQYRHAVGGFIYELPAGKIDDQEPPLETARRELEEEAGMRAGDWQSLGRMYSSPGFCDEVIHLYLARDLTPVPIRQEEHEVIEVEWVPFDEALERAANGDIDDAKSVTALFRASQFNL